MKVYDGETLAQILHRKYGMPSPWAYRAVQIAFEFGEDSEPIGKLGSVTIKEIGENGPGRYTLTESFLKDPGKVAKSAPVGYNRTLPEGKAIRPVTPRRVSTMAPRKKAAPAPEPEGGAYAHYADKEPTVTMVDFHDWLLAEVYEDVYPHDDVDRAFLDGVRLGGTLRMEFQKSEFNIQRREERQAEREAGREEKAAGAAAPKRGPKTASRKPEPEPEPEEEAPKPAARRSTRAAKANGRKPAAKAATGRRGRTATAEAPY